MLTKTDTIAAIATAPGRGGIGVVRVSGADLTGLICGIVSKPVDPRKATFRSFKDEQGNIIDQGIVLYFPAPNSYTGEQTLELQGHGGSAVLQLVLQRCLELGARIARPGEFTERAFLNNKLDLAQAESVADLIDATTSQAAKSAVRSLIGEFSHVVHDLVEQLINLRMLVEAMLDFPEEELDLPDIERRNSRLRIIQDLLQKTLDTARQGSLLREGAQIALIGQPNVGKSSLLNQLSGEEVALVSSVPGTTRDVIRQSVQISGVPFHIIDTAGLRESQDEVELMGIARTRNMMQKADAVLLVIDAKLGISDNDRNILAELPVTTPRLFIYNKIDLIAVAPGIQEQGNESVIYLSAKQGTGIQLLRDKLLNLVGWHQEAGVFMARERHIQALMQAQTNLQNAALLVNQAELFAEELRLTQEALNSITGKFTADDLLGEIFSRFCIGK